VVFGGSVARECKRAWEITTWEVNMAGSSREAAQAFLRWSEVVVTFDEAEHPDHTPYSGHFHLLVSSNIGQTHIVT
jgi:hypothetical protein